MSDEDSAMDDERHQQYDPSRSNTHWDHGLTQIGPARPTRPARELATWRQDFSRCLDSIEGTGRIASFDHYPKFVNPGITIAGKAPIPLPLTEYHAETVIKTACRQVSLERGDETTVNTTVPNPWELDHTQFQLENLAWSSFLDEAVRNVGDGLGLEGLTAELDKLLLYEPGSFFGQNKESKNERGMVATLVVCLPSEHQGADVRVSFLQQKYILSTAPTSRFDLSTMAWFSDASHDAEELISGYRLVLKYKIFSPQSISATIAHEQRQMIGGFFSKWLIQHDQPARLVYPLKHKYTEASLSLENMKGRDRSVCTYLNDTCSKAGFYFMIARMTHERSEEPNVSFNVSVEAQNTVLNTIYSAAGRAVSSNIHIEEEEILGAGFGTRAPGSADERIQIGNETGLARLRYHDTVALLVPKKYITSYMKPAAPAGSEVETLDIMTASLVSMISEDFENSPHDATAKDVTLKVIRSLARSTVSLPVETVCVVAKWALNLCEVGLWAHCVSMSIQRHHYLSGIFQALQCHLNGQRVEFRWATEFQSFVEAAGVGEIHQLIDRCHQNLISKPHLCSFNAWAQPILDQMIESQVEWQSDDVKFTFTCIQSRYEDSAWVLGSFIPLVSSRGSSEFLFELLHEMWRVKDKRDKTYNKAMYECIILHADTKLDLRTEDLSDATPASKPLTHARRFVRFYKECNVDYGSRGLADTILERSLGGICRKSWPPIENHQFFEEEIVFPLFKAMWHYRNPPTSATRGFFKLAFRNVIHAKIAPQFRPTRRPGWAHKPRGCELNCQDCQTLDTFLGSQERVWMFKVDATRRDHIESRLPKKCFALATLWTGSPCTLEITKLSRDIEYDCDVADFQKRVNLMDFNLLKYTPPYLRYLLGEDLHRELVLLKQPYGGDIWGDIPGLKRKYAFDESDSILPRVQIC